MIPKMPALIPSNPLNPRFKVPESTQPPSNLPFERITSSDELLNKHMDLDKQIQLVRQIQTLLGTEQVKLEMMMKLFDTQNKKRNETTETANQELEPTHLRVCSPSSINRNLSTEKSWTNPVEKETGDMNIFTKTQHFKAF